MTNDFRPSNRLDEIRLRSDVQVEIISSVKLFEDAEGLSVAQVEAHRSQAVDELVEADVLLLARVDGGHQATSELIYVWILERVYGQSNLRWRSLSRTKPVSI